MTRQTDQLDPRVLDLLADEVSVGLDPAGRAELDAALGDDAFTDLELAAAALDLAFAAEAADAEREPMPEQLRSRVLASVETSSFAGEPEPSVIAQIGPDRGAAWVAWGGWAAAAAIAIVAGVSLIGAPKAAAPETPSVLEARTAFVAEATDLERGAWGDWDNPEISGVTGEVVWSDELQRGFMTFSGLPAADPSVEQYQLWIVDRRGLADPDSGLSERISGGVFDLANAETDPTTGAFIVPITPAIRVQGAGAFALTIEEPGGVAVSDMSRRVVIASTSG